MEEIEALKKIPLFVNMDDTELAGVRALMRDSHYIPGQIIIREGDETWKEMVPPPVAELIVERGLFGYEAERDEGNTV